MGGITKSTHLHLSWTTTVSAFKTNSLTLTRGRSFQIKAEKEDEIIPSSFGTYFLNPLCIFECESDKK